MCLLHISIVCMFAYFMDDINCTYQLYVKDNLKGLDHLLVLVMIVKSLNMPGTAIVG